MQANQIENTSSLVQLAGSGKACLDSSVEAVGSQQM